MILNAQNLLEKLNILQGIVKNQRKENNTLKIENLFLKERVYKLKQNVKENNLTPNKGEHAKDIQFTSNENFSN